MAEKKWVGILFECCSIYSRLYINKGGTGYTGNCPKCGRKVSIRIGSGGTDSRFFTAK